jgi:hypothetical protein
MILSDIFSFLDHGLTLLYTALACRQFSHPALVSLWWDLSSPQPLLRL